MLAVPLLGGSLLRIVLGVMTDHIGARRTGLIGLVLTIIQNDGSDAETT